MSEITRLGFMKSSAGTAAGLTAIGALVAPGAQADTDSASAEDVGPAGSEPVVAYVKDPATGEIALMHGTNKVVLHDRALAAKLDRAARS